MLARLDHAFSAQRHFLDETSHELRTPLTVIQGNVELLHLDSPEERRHTVDLVMDELERMEHRVNHLFLLARAEHPEFLTMVATDARQIVADVHRKAAALGERDWHLDVGDAVPVVADTNRLAQALLQLADNAVKHTRPGDQISIGTGEINGNPHLWVDDRGAGIPPEDPIRDHAAGSLLTVTTRSRRKTRLEAADHPRLTDDLTGAARSSSVRWMAIVRGGDWGTQH